MEFIKKHKFVLIGTFVFLLLIIFAVIGIKELIYPDTRKDLYGNRLEGIEDVVINHDKLDKVSLTLKENEQVNSTTSNIKGRIVNFVIDVKQDTDLITSKSLADEILKDFTEEEKDYYDFQVYIVSSIDEESELYPIIGYRHKTSLGFKWTNN